jgi:hypothetical protein
MRTVYLYFEENGRTPRGERVFRLSDSSGNPRSIEGYEPFIQTVAGLPNQVQYKIACRDIPSETKIALEAIIKLKNALALTTEAQSRASTRGSA